jgi:hypothetical protein
MPLHPIVHDERRTVTWGRTDAVAVNDLVRRSPNTVSMGDSGEAGAVF